MKLELLTNATVVGDAIRFVTYDASNNTPTRIQGQGQEEEAVKPKAEASILGSTEEDNDIQRSEEETKNRSEDPTTNSIF